MPAAPGQQAAQGALPDPFSHRAAQDAAAAAAAAAAHAQARPLGPKHSSAGLPHVAAAGLQSPEPDSEWDNYYQEELALSLTAVQASGPLFVQHPSPALTPAAATAPLPHNQAASNSQQLPAGGMTTGAVDADPTEVVKWDFGQQPDGIVPGAYRGSIADVGMPGPNQTGLAARGTVIALTATLSVTISQVMVQPNSTLHRTPLAHLPQQQRQQQQHQQHQQEQQHQNEALPLQQQLQNHHQQQRIQPRPPPPAAQAGEEEEEEEQDYSHLPPCIGQPHGQLPSGGVEATQRHEHHQQDQQAVLDQNGVPHMPRVLTGTGKRHTHQAGHEMQHD